MPTRTILDLAFNTYLAEKPAEKRKSNMDLTFKRFAISQVKLFLFSGRDTTSSSMDYIFYLLSNHPKALHQMRKEHEQLLGPDVAERANRLSADPFLLNKLPIRLLS